MIEDTTLKRLQMKGKYQKMKIPSSNKQTLFTFHDGTRYQDEKCLSSKETCHWDLKPIEDN